MNITKQNFKKTILVGAVALSIAAFTGCSDSANSSTADTTKQQTTAEQTTEQATETTAKSDIANESFDLKSLHTCKENPNDDLVGAWQITSGEGSQYESFYYMFNGEGKSILISGTSGYFGSYTYGTDDDSNPTFTTKLVFGLNGTYTYKLSDDKKTAELTNTSTKAVSTLKKADNPDFIPTPEEDASIDDDLVGCWMSDSGEYLCFDKSGIMYQNLFDYMFAYSNYTAKDGQIVSTYTTSDQKTTDKYTYSVKGDTLTLNNDTYSRISFSDLK